MALVAGWHSGSATLHQGGPPIQDEDPSMSSGEEYVDVRLKAHIRLDCSSRYMFTVKPSPGNRRAFSSI
eukprot:1027864-Amphidinium_carterae.1